MRISSYFAGALLMLAVLVAFVVQYSVNHLVRAGAEASGTQWVTYLRESTPQLDKYLKIGALHPAQKFSLGSISLGPALIRFTIFDAHGAPLLSRDEEFQQFAPEFEVPNAIAQRVIETGDAIALLERGGQEEGLPDFYSITYAPIFDAEGGVIGVIKVFVDQTEIAAFYGRVFYWLAGGLTVLCCTVFALPSYAFLRQKEAAVTARKRAEFLVRHDVMTGLLNRAAFMEAFHGWGAVGDRVIGFLDCDRFKQINDTMGHEAGDVFLCHVAARLTECLPEDALIARFGGDEFVVGLRDLDYRKARDVLVRAQTAVANPVLEEERQISGTVSIGLSFAGEGAGTDALLQEADAALYAAKAAGGNCVRLFSGDLAAAHARRATVEASLKRALAEDRFDLHYQPMFAAASGRVEGYEALLRLPMLKNAVVSPAEFVPVAEEMGLMPEIGRWVLNSATEQAALGLDGASVAVNLSAAQFETGTLLEDVAHALQQSGLAPDLLHLEITEALLLREDRQVAVQLDGLQELGVKIVLDDFGTGHSSLSYLWRYGFDMLKVDRSFLAGLERDPGRTRDVLDAIVLLGKRLNMRVGVEGIETQAQLDHARAMGCDLMQGYLFAKPMPPEQLRIWQQTVGDAPRTRVG